MAAAPLQRPQRATIDLKNRLKLGDWIFTALTGAAAALLLAVILGLFYELTKQAWPTITKVGPAFVYKTAWDPSRS